jgi:hypothetical protein
VPLSALREIAVDHTLGAAEMGPLLYRLAGGGQAEAAKNDEPVRETVKVGAQLTDLTCPDCRGTIWEVSRGDSKDYRCRVGHTYSAKSMLAGHFAAQEKAFYAAIVALEEGASLAQPIGRSVRSGIRCPVTDRSATAPKPSRSDPQNPQGADALRELNGSVRRDFLGNKPSFLLVAGGGGLQSN